MKLFETMKCLYLLQCKDFQLLILINSYLVYERAEIATPLYITRKDEEQTNLKMSKTVAVQIAQIYNVLNRVSTSGENSKLVVQCLMWLEALNSATITEDEETEGGGNE